MNQQSLEKESSRNVLQSESTQTGLLGALFVLLVSLMAHYNIEVPEPYVLMVLGMWGFKVIGRQLSDVRNAGPARVINRLVAGEDG